jgi:predicted nucleic-acid-binding Zn-ribbon protein
VDCALAKSCKTATKIDPKCPKCESKTFRTGPVELGTSSSKITSLPAAANQTFCKITSDGKAPPPEGLSEVQQIAADGQ